MRKTRDVEVRYVLNDALECADKITATRSREFDHRVAELLYTLVDIVRVSGVTFAKIPRPTNPSDTSA